MFHSQSTQAELLFCGCLFCLSAALCMYLSNNFDREDCKTLPILAMSANAFDEDVKRSIASGMNGHLSKPVNVSLLKETLASILG